MLWFIIVEYSFNIGIGKYMIIIVYAVTVDLLFMKLCIISDCFLLIINKQSNEQDPIWATQ